MSQCVLFLIPVAYKLKKNLSCLVCEFLIWSFSAIASDGMIKVNYSR